MIKNLGQQSFIHIISISQLSQLRMFMKASLNSTKLAYVDGISKRGPQVWAMGLALKPLHLMKATSIFLSIITSIAVVNRKNCRSFGISRPLTNRCKNLNASLSPSLCGFEVRQDSTFFVVGLRLSQKPSTAVIVWNWGCCFNCCTKGCKDEIMRCGF